MAYLIPKSARNIKIQLFKGLGVFEAVLVVISGLIGFTLISVLGFKAVTFVFLILLVLITAFLVSPSFLVNKKGYQIFGILITYYYQQKDFVNRKKKGINKDASNK